MTLPAIQVRHLSKRYRLGGALADASFREMVNRVAGAAWHRLLGYTPLLPEQSGEIAALDDVSFDVAPGEVIGVVGGNGAGKSTLLKILSQITDPTDGEAFIRGRVASLLEVGTGFHPELSGRENIFLNGAILGLTQREIAQRFDQIVDFSGVEQFLDTPVKHYSSGMTMRLAFAVAAHLEPEILIIDEVLAVGDMEFQRKCLGKMQEVARNSGRTVLFVSHNMPAVAQLCSRAIMLQNGRLVMDAPALEVTRAYMTGLSQRTGGVYRRTAPVAQSSCILSAQLNTLDGRPCSDFLMSEPIRLDCELHVQGAAGLALSVQLIETSGSPIAHMHTNDAGFRIPSTPGTRRLSVTLPALNLYPGEYLVVLTLTDVAGQHYTKLESVEALRYAVTQDPKLTSRPLSRTAALLFANAEWRLASDARSLPRAA